MAADRFRGENTSVVLSALRSHRRELEAFVNARVPPADVDDVIQLASIRAAGRAAQLEHPDRVLAWLYRIIRRVISDERRSSAARERRVQLVADPPEPATPDPDEACGCSVKLTSGLPPTHAAILALVDLGGASIGEASAQLGVTRNTATVRLHRARRALRERLREHCGVTSPRDCLDCRCAHAGCCD